MDIDWRLLRYKWWGVLLPVIHSQWRNSKSIKLTMKAVHFAIMKCVHIMVVLLVHQVIQKILPNKLFWKFKWKCIKSWLRSWSKWMRTWQILLLLQITLVVTVHCCLFWLRSLFIPWTEITSAWVWRWMTQIKRYQKTNLNVSATCFDLQQILYTPQSNESVVCDNRKLYFQRDSLWIRFTGKLLSHVAWSNVWLGPCEDVTCMFRFLSHQAKLCEGEKRFCILITGGQNKNAKKASLLKNSQHEYLE